MKNDQVSRIAMEGRLYEVDIMRFILIAFLLMDHSFAPFSGGWKPVMGQIDVPLYWFVAKLSGGLFLQMFVFISGYVYGMKYRTSNKMSYKKELIKKTNRLIIPSLIFSFLYFLLFEDKQQPFQVIIYSIVSGCGHMWFLPMLFWCFVLVIFIEHFKLNPVIVLPISLVVSLLAFIPLPLRLSQTFGYFVFFYIGFLIKKYDLKIIFLSKPKYFIISFVIYIICFVASIYVNNQGFDENIIFYHASRIVVDNMIRFFYTFFGLLFLYLFSIYFSERLSLTVLKLVPKIAGYCFGIYLYQQFILKFFYYDVYNESFSIYLLPWVGLLLASFGSAFLTSLTFKLPIGRKLIG